VGLPDERSGRRGAGQELPGDQPPATPWDRTHVFHKYRVGLDPAAAGLSCAPATARDRLLDALRAAGVEAVLWQRVPLTAHPVFGVREPSPHAAEALERSIIIGSQSYPLFAQPLDVVDAWADGFEKAWTSLRS